MEFKELYLRWRWLTYNQLDSFEIKRRLSGNVVDNQETNYSKQKLEDFKNKDFSISRELINKYDKNIYQKVNLSEPYGKEHNISIVNYPRSSFIENCFIIIDQYEYRQIKRKIKKNIILYYWWDDFNFNELSESIISLHFLRSTTKLIEKNKIIEYFKKRFENKNEFIEYLLQHFEPRIKMIQEMNSIIRNNVVFDYRWLFYNDLKKSIRIFENECRLEFNEKIIGSFYNENVLFREIKRVYENKYSVISQGSPEWLGQQRFDIYFPELNIALEYQGEQHQKPVDFGGKGKKIAKKQFEQNLIRDKAKKDKSEKNNCEIIFVYPDYELKKLIKELNSKILEKKEKL